MKIRLVGAESFHPNGWTGRRIDRHDKAIRNFGNAPKFLKPFWNSSHVSTFAVQKAH
jgi:hypothetical protein